MYQATDVNEYMKFTKKAKFTSTNLTFVPNSHLITYEGL